MDQSLKVARAVGGLLVIIAFLGLTVAHVFNVVTFGTAERLVLLGLAYTLLGIDRLLKAFFVAVERIDISVKRDVDNDNE